MDSVPAVPGVPGREATPSDVSRIAPSAGGTAAGLPATPRGRPSVWTRGTRTGLALQALLVGLLGLLPHALFSLRVGHPTFMTYAFDEDFYVLQALHGEGRPDRALGSLLVRAIHAVTGRDLDLTCMLSDLVFPALCLLAAVFFARAVTRDGWQGALVVLGLLCGQELLSLGCWPIWSPMVDVPSLRESLPPEWRMLTPVYMTTFLQVFRTPEPQVSWVVMFALLALLARIARDEDCSGRRRWALVALNGLLPFTYLFCSIPALLAEMALACAALGRGNRLVAARIGGAAFFALVGFAGTLAWARASALYGFSRVFPCHLPVVSPSVAGSCLVLAWMGARARRWGATGSLRADLAWILAFLPLVLTNQQIVTGIQVSTKEWETTSCFALLVAAVTLACSGGGEAQSRARCPPCVDAGHRVVAHPRHGPGEDVPGVAVSQPGIHGADPCLRGGRRDGGGGAAGPGGRPRVHALDRGPVRAQAGLRALLCCPLEGAHLEHAARRGTSRRSTGALRPSLRGVGPLGPDAGGCRRGPSPPEPDTDGPLALVPVQPPGRVLPGHRRSHDPPRRRWHGRSPTSRPRTGHSCLPLRPPGGRA